MYLYTEDEQNAKLNLGIVLNIHFHFDKFRYVAFPSINGSFHGVGATFSCNVHVTEVSTGQFTIKINPDMVKF